MQDQDKQHGFAESVLKRAISHPRRVEILDLLIKKRTSTDEGELVNALNLTPPRMKYHLSVLHAAGLITHVDAQGPEGADRYVAATSARL